MPAKNDFIVQRPINIAESSQYQVKKMTIFQKKKEKLLLLI